ncbi:hypothetical protein P691DRAFT_795008 [Macrolepiota fuliginosa MF-IS2]|uniref:Glycoside hydrolase family 105 protein n=1 Tax=Macrolepiota fuliginosa MF-IS2 TaxID=1400762 RepID=A0A9P6C1U7_9AGAR|nr:hypothetical protein P691DRAFT_795008 [Macrolepiota fuliginosa MF-IS2]
MFEGHYHVIFSGERGPFPFDPGFDIRSVAALAKSIPSHSWEFGTASETLLELYDPDISVFGSSPFSVTPQYLRTHTGQIQALEYAKSVITLGTGVNGLADGDGAVGDPASLGVSAVLLSDYLTGGDGAPYGAAADGEVDYIINDAPRWTNGAISHRANYAELWADFVYMAPPFLAYYAVHTSNLTLLQATVEQCGLYRDVLQSLVSDGLWEHIIGPNSPDHGLWSTGNAWAAAGMTRVLATVKKAPKSLFTSAKDAQWKGDAIDSLTTWIKEILDGAIDSPQESGLLRNYLDDVSGDGHGFGEISGSSLLASVAYRMAVLRPDVFVNPYGGNGKYLDFAEGIRTVLGQDDHITSNGTATPAVNPLGWGDTTPFTAGSPEGQNFVVLLYVAWRDCIKAGIC